MPNENALEEVLSCNRIFSMLEENMDLLKKVATGFERLLSVTYYFEIAKKQNIYKFALSFQKSDFYHLAGLHKLTDIASLQGEPSKEKVFNNILNGSITYNLIEHSRFFPKMNVRLGLLGKIENILDSNQIVFKYINSSHQTSRIQADFLLENVYGLNIVFMFLNDRSNAERSDVPIMCCRSFFPMENFDYTRNQPTYTLLRKIKTDTATGISTVQYDRSKIISQAKAAQTESERRSIMQQLNEKRAQLAINDVLAEKRSIQKNKQDHGRF